MNDPYSTLGVSRNATDEEIKKAYRDLARKYHPDNYHDNPLADLAQEKMKEINEAYDAITKQRAGGGSGSTGGGSGYAVVNTGRLYLRSAASKSSKSLGLFSRGTYVTVLEQGSTWCRVKVNGTTGYMMTAYLKFHGMSSEATAMVNHPAGTYVNLRNAPSKTSGAVLVRVPHGAKVTVLVPGATWSQIKYNGTTGYMMTQFLKK